MNFPKEIPTNKAWKYAQTEWERTFLLKAPPLDISHLPFKQLEDNYLKHSQMRLRKAFDGTNTYFKLSKKVQLQSQSQQWVSSIYLNSTEYELFVHLPAYYLKKSRYYFRSEDGISIGLDHIKLKDKELWLAEIEFSSKQELRSFIPAFDFIREVSEESSFAGVKLAQSYSSP